MESSENQTGIVDTNLFNLQEMAKNNKPPLLTGNVMSVLPGV